MMNCTISPNDVWVVTPKAAVHLGAPTGLFVHHGRHVWFWFTEYDEFIGTVVTETPEAGGYGYLGKTGAWQIHVKVPSKQ